MRTDELISEQNQLLREQNELLKQQQNKIQEKFLKLFAFVIITPNDILLKHTIRTSCHKAIADFEDTKSFLWAELTKKGFSCKEIEIKLI